MPDSPEIMVTVTTLRCARCPRRFKVLNIESLTEFFCPNPKCKCRHIKLDGQWYDEVVEKIRQAKARDLAERIPLYGADGD